jgi:hypothetical protein
VRAKAKSRGTGSSTLWKLWSTYKNVAPVIAGANLICAQARESCRQQPFGRSGLAFDQFLPFQMAMLMPDFVLAVGLEFERTGLSSDGHSETVLDSETLWRIPTDNNVVALRPLTRKIRPQDISVLQDRRAGNRGRANRKPIPV